MSTVRSAAEPDRDPDAGQPVVAPPPGNQRFPHVDALRAIAAFTVLGFHAAYATGSIHNRTVGPYLLRLNLGVTLFFLISGFLLYRPFVAHRMLGTPPTRLRDYARRRLLRILPAYWLALTVLAIWPGLPGVFTSHWWVYYFFLQSYDLKTLLSGLGPAWTLCIEMTFYICLPAYAWLCARALRHVPERRRPAAELAALALIAVAGLAYRYWIVSERPFSATQYTLLCTSDWFIDGMAFAVISVWLTRTGARPAIVRLIARAPWVCWLGALVAFWAASRVVGGPHPLVLGGQTAYFYTGREDLGVHVLYAVVAACLLAPAVIGTDGGGRLRRLLLTPWLAFLGLISYGVYLWQQPLLNKACGKVGLNADTVCDFHGVGVLTHVAYPALLVLTFVPTVICAALSYRLVERPILRFKASRS